MRQVRETGSELWGEEAKWPCEEWETLSRRGTSMSMSIRRHGHENYIVRSTELFFSPPKTEHDNMEIAIHPLNTAAIAVVALLVLMAVKKYRGRRSHPLPPGPPGEFLLGHLRVIPFEDAPTAYLKWGVEYSTVQFSIF